MYRVLLLEDDPDDRLHIDGLLREQNWEAVEIDHVESVEAAEWALTRSCYNVLIVDWHLGGGPRDRQSGTDFLKRMYQKRIQIPSILVSGQSHVPLDSVVLSLIEAGHVQFLPKQKLDPATLFRALTTALSQAVHVLLVEPRPDVAHQISMALRLDLFYQFEVRVERFMSSVKNRLAHQHFDLLLVHEGSSASQRMHAIRQLISSGRVKDTALVLYGERGASGLDEESLRMLGRRHLSYIPEHRMKRPSVAGEVIHARNLALSFRASADSAEVEANKMTRSQR